jgi:outer membrane murein-binding lipoprotein Lpp
MVALTITIGAVVLTVLLVAAVRSLRRASRKIDTILREELDPRDEDG